MKPTMIMALKGHSSTTKSLIAHKLADFLKYPLIKEDDILALQNSLPTSSEKAIISTEHLNNLSFELACQIVSTQLQLRISVIVNTRLFNRYNLDRLVQLASSTGASLIIIECKTEDYDENDDIGYVPKFTVDTTRPFVVEDFVSDIPQLAEFHPKRDQVITRGNLSISLSSKTLQEKVDGIDIRRKQTASKKIHRHLHALYLTEQPRKGNELLSCKSCLEPVSGPTYRCIVCDQFTFHQSCAESPALLGHDIPDYLKAISPAEYNFPETRRCLHCEDFSYDCHDCLLETNLKCGFLPTILNLEEHQHPLNLVVMPLTYNYEYDCSVCLNYGRSISYKCYDCYFDLHVNCALLPRTVSSRCHPHPLTIMRIPYHEHVYYCDDCKNEVIFAEEWVYCCLKCQYMVHRTCVFSSP